MRTTLDFNDALMKKAKAEALKRGITLTRLVETALDRELHDPPKRKEPFTWTVVHGETMELPFDLNDRNSMEDWFDAHPNEDDE
jgi:hypothetical protein